MPCAIAATRAISLPLKLADGASVTAGGSTSSPIAKCLHVMWKNMAPGLRPTPKDHGRHLFRRIRLHSRRNVRVKVKRYRDLGVAKSLGNDFGMDACRQRQ